jgi:hypothetical protein
MKYIKQFENRSKVQINYAFNKNDYVLFYDEDINDNVFPLERVIHGNGITKGIILESFISKFGETYEIALVYGEQKGYHTSVKRKDILRLLTAEEIEEIQFINDSEKYNL